MSQREHTRLLIEFGRWGYDERGWSPNTRERYTNWVRVADRWLTANGETLWRATTRDLRGFLFDQSANAQTRNNARQALVAFYDYLVDENYRDDNPATGLPRLPVPRMNPRPLETAEAEACARVAPLFGPKIDALVHAFLFTGMRATEVRTLRWVSIEGDGGWIRFVGKGRRERVLPLHPILAAKLSAWRPECPDVEFVFPGRNPGRPMSETAMRDTIRAVGDEVGIAGLHPHRFRHTLATTLVEQGTDLRTVQEVLGHSSLAMTAVYTKVRPARLREAIVALDYGRNESGPGSQT